MNCLFCKQYMMLSSVESAFNLQCSYSICRLHRPFIVGVMNHSVDGHYGYWIAVNGIQIIVNLDKELTIVNKFKSVYERCGKDFAKKNYPLLLKNDWCYCYPFFDKRLYTINYLIDVSPETFNDVLKRIERLKAFS